jgi:hypothetical protein
VKPSLFQMGKNTIGPKDQSGHEVDCVLRSIYTDTLNKSVMGKNGDEALEKRLDRLNDAMCDSGLYREDVFLLFATTPIL